MIELTASPYADAASLALLHSLWEGALLAAGAALTSKALSKSSAQARYAAACGFLLAILLAPIVTFFILLPAASAPGATPLIPLRHAPLATLGPFETPRDSAWLPSVLAFWAIGVALFAIRAAGGWSLAAWQLSTGRVPAGPAVYASVRQLASRLRIRQAVRVFESSRAAVPVVFGAIRPVLLLPASAMTGLTPAQLEAILAHELAHIARHDFAVNCVQSVVEVLLFYHPAVWWLSARIRQEREMCCDAIAAALCGDRVLYSRALLALEEGRQEFAVAATGGNLKTRIERLFQQPAPARRAAGLVAFLTVVVTAAVVCSAAAMSAAPDPQEQRSESRFSKWVDRDVAYIITAAERARWDTLKDDAERDQFIKEFWLRRDPDPSTPKNEFKEEHYRRIAYANEHFSDGLPGWRTDRGRIYILYGPPNEIEAHPDEPREIWRYSADRMFEFSGERYELREDANGQLTQHLSDTLRSQNQPDSRYATWVSKDVAYLITAEERARWDTLKDDAERDQFIKEFWLRRDPDPSTPDNEAKKEHYRRIAYANERFADGRPGWRTDRGRIYIQYGPANEVESHPDEPREIWRYSADRVFEFSGERYQLREEKTGQAGPNSSH